MAAVWALALLSAAEALDLATPTSASMVDPCIRAGGINCGSYQTPEPAQAIATTSRGPPQYRLIRANGTEHVYFQMLAEAQKHLIRKGLCNVCGYPEVCKAVVDVDEAYIDTLETSTDFTCDMLDTEPSEVAVVSDQESTLPGSSMRAQMPWAAVAVAVLLTVALCGAMIYLAMRTRPRKRATRGLQRQDPHGGYLPMATNSFMLPASSPQLEEEQPKEELPTESWMMQDLDLVTVTPHGYEVRPIGVKEAKALGVKYVPTVTAPALSPAAASPVSFESINLPERAAPQVPTLPPTTGQMRPVMPGAAGVASALTSIVGPPDQLPVPTQRAFPTGRMAHN